MASRLPKTNVAHGRPYLPYNKVFFNGIVFLNKGTFFKEKKHTHTLTIIFGGIRSDEARARYRRIGHKFQKKFIGGRADWGGLASTAESSKISGV